MIQELKQQIKDKFGSLSSFYRCAELDPYEIQKLFASASKKMTGAKEVKLLILKKLCEAVSTELDSERISNDLRTEIGREITARGGVYKVNRSNPEFGIMFLYGVIDGTRKRLTKEVKELTDCLNIKP